MQIGQTGSGTDSIFKQMWRKVHNAPVPADLTALSQQLTHQTIVEYMIMATRYYMPYLRVIRAPADGMRGHHWLVSPFEAIICYDATLPVADRYIAVAEAIHQLWQARHLAGLSEHDHQRRPHLSAVS